MSKKTMTRRTPLACALSAATAVIGMTFAMQAMAFSEIPLTLEEAKAVATADEESSIAVGGTYTNVNGSGPTAAEAWNGYAQNRGGADVDVNLKGGEGLTSWAVQGTDLGTPIPEIIGEYGVASKWDVDARYKRFRHVFAETGILPQTTTALKTNTALGSLLENTTLEQVRDVYAVNGRVFVLPQMTVTAGYQLDQRKGDLALSSREHASSEVNRDIVYGVDDRHHQVKLVTDYVGSNWTVGANYYLSKFDAADSELIRPVIAADGVRFLGRSLDPSNTLHRIGLEGSYQPTDRTTLSMRAAYTWNQLDANVYDMPTGISMNGLPKDFGMDADVKMPEFSIGLTSRPIDPLSVKVDYSFHKYDQNVSGMEDLPNSYFTSSHPEDWYNTSYKENKVIGQAIYAFTQGYSVKVHGKYQKRDYEGDVSSLARTAVDSVATYEAGIELRKRMSQIVTGSLGYTYSGRKTKDWEAEGAYPWNLLSYDQHSVDARLRVTPIGSLTLSAMTSFYTRDYKGDGFDIDEVSAMSKVDGVLFSLDADWAPSRDWNVFAYYNYDRMKSDVQSITRRWTNNTTSASHTVGIGFGLHPYNYPWKATFRYVYGYDTDDIDWTSTTPWTNDNKSHYASASVDYKLSSRWVIMGNALYGHASSFDLRRQGVYYAGDAAMDVTQSPNFNAFGFYIGAKYLLP